MEAVRIFDDRYQSKPVRPDRTGRSIGDRAVYRQTGRSEIQTDTGPDRPATGTGLSRSDRTEPAGLPVRTGLPVTGRSEIQIGTGPDRPVTGTGSLSGLNAFFTF
jgi:hypothetical protein